MRIYIISLVGLFLTSCSNFLKEYSQDRAYVRSYQDLDELLVGETYMKTEPYFPYLHLMADDARENNIPVDWDDVIDFNEYSKKYFGYITWQNRVGYSVDKLSVKNEDEDWNKLYKHINLANMVLYSIDKQKAGNDDERGDIRRIRGEAYFLRAAYYFILVNMYGQPYVPSVATTALGVPVKKTAFIEDKAFPRETLKVVYDLIVEDLEHAAENLDGIPRKSIYRANITAVRLLQSRVCLYMQDWENAAKYARMALELQPELVDLNSFASSTEAFVSSSSPELVFSMGGNSIPDMFNVLFSGISVSEDLKKCYVTGDLRTSYFVIKDGDNGYWDCNKYVRLGEDYVSDVSDNFILRTAEACLNLAEAYAYMDKESEACKMLDHLRVNRFQKDAYKPTTVKGDDLIEEIRSERRRELCFEGHRWFDLRRYTVCEKKPFVGNIRNTYTEYDYYDVKSVSTYELKANDPAWTLQIPFEVIQFEELVPNERNERTPILTE